MLEGAPDFDWIERLQVGTFLLLDVLECAVEVRSISLSCLYWKADDTIKEKALSTYFAEGVTLATARLRGAGQGEQCTTSCVGNRCPHRLLWFSLCSSTSPLVAEVLTFILFVIGSNTFPRGPWSELLMVPLDLPQGR